MLVPSLSWGQNASPTYQPDAVRQICQEAAVSVTPGGEEVDRVGAGGKITVTDLSFDADGGLYFNYGDPDRPRFVASTATRNFCGYGDHAQVGSTAFLAPPNTCHVIAASRRTLDEVNLFAADYPGYASVMNVFRSQNGWYAISLGLVSNQIAGQVLSNGQDIPDDAYCSDGTNYFDVMDQREGRFLELDPPAPDNPADRRKEANDLSVDHDSAETLRRSCLLGNGPGCGLYANLLNQSEDPSDAEVEQTTRFNLLGCMLGEPVACNNALFGKTVRNRAVFAAFPDRTGAASAPQVLDPELAKIGCDAGLAPSCGELAKPAIQYASKDVTDYLTSVEATHHACKLAQGWYCKDFAERLDYRRTVMDSDWPPVALFGSAKVFADVCRIDGNADFVGCRQSYVQYKGFIASGQGDEDQRRVAALSIRDGCDRGSPTACAYQSMLTGNFSLLQRRLAAAKVRAACATDNAGGDVCDRLETMLGGDLPEAQDPIRIEYEKRAETCRTTEGTDGTNPCGDALWFYGGHISLDDITEPLALLRENCAPGGRITGCAPLYRYYDGDEMLFAGDGVRARWPKQPEKALEVLQTGCVATLEGVSNCASLGLMWEQQGDFTAGAQAYATGCETSINVSSEGSFGQLRVCLWAGENAYNNLQDYAKARRWLGYTCHVHNDPFSCKYLGLMAARAQGGPADSLAALALYQRGCNMLNDLEQRDGQACLLYGQAIVTHRTKVLLDGGRDDQIVMADDGSSGSHVAENMTEASRAYLRACTEDMADACMAHAALLEQWSDGTYPRDEYECRVIDAQGRMAPAKPCQRFSFYLAAPEGNGDAGWADIFVWPDGDRTVTFDNHGEPTLNGAAGTWILPEGGWQCIHNAVTGRSFCHEAT